MVLSPTAPVKMSLPTDFKIPWVSNCVLAALHPSLNVFFQLFVLPIYFLPLNLWWAVTLIPIAAVNIAMWALIHEAIHDLLSPMAGLDAVLGRSLAIGFGLPFQALRLTHLSHHKFNRSPAEKGTEIYDPTSVSRNMAGLKYFVYIFCGLYPLEVFSTLVFFLPLAIFRRLLRRVIETGNHQEAWLAKKIIGQVAGGQNPLGWLAIGLWKPFKFVIFTQPGRNALAFLALSEMLSK